MVWGSFLIAIAAAALKTPTRNGYNAQGVNLTFICIHIYTYMFYIHTYVHISVCFLSFSDDAHVGREARLLN